MPEKIFPFFVAGHKLRQIDIFLIQYACLRPNGSLDRSTDCRIMHTESVCNLLQAVTSTPKGFFHSFLRMGKKVSTTELNDSQGGSAERGL